MMSSPDVVVLDSKVQLVNTHSDNLHAAELVQGWGIS